MNDKIRTVQDTIDRYCRMLATELTELERQFLHRRIAEERVRLEQLSGRWERRPEPA
jgi:hypothetical protein